jgi:hypothetical protein
MKTISLQAAQNARVSLFDARTAGREARETGKPFTAVQYGAGTLESQAFAAGWRTADYDIRDGIPASLNAALFAR